jgi:hypothetical protein
MMDVLVAKDAALTGRLTRRRVVAKATVGKAHSVDEKCLGDGARPNHQSRDGCSNEIETGDTHEELPVG